MQNFNETFFKIFLFVLGVILGSFMGLVICFLIGFVCKEGPQMPTSTPKFEKNRSLLLPEPLKIIHRSAYTLSYDNRTRNALWVYERLTADGLKGEVDRKQFQFMEDEIIPKLFRATLADYRGSGFDRGHLAPAADNKSAYAAMLETFYLSNVSPQHPRFNRGYWQKLERYVRDLTREYAVVNVFTGPLFLPQQESDGTRWVKYQILGSHDVAVPTHFFKVLFLENKAGKQESQAFILPNEPIAIQTPLDVFMTTVEKVEKASGIIFRKGHQ